VGIGVCEVKRIPQKLYIELMDSGYLFQDGASMETVVHIEILKDGRDFVARAHLANGSVKEYRHQIFEDVLTEMVIDLQEELAE